MEIATVLSVHSDIDTVLDTIDSIQCYLTNDILVLIDGASHNFPATRLPTHRVHGFPHGCNRSPYRNVALSLKLLSEAYPNAAWYNYMEYDCLVASNRVRRSLSDATSKGVYMLGSDGHVDSKAMPLINSLVGADLTSKCYYLLGACQFFSRQFICKLREIDFFERFLSLTNSFGDGVFPFYDGYDISEHMYPTLARHFGGNIGVFAAWDSGVWHGNYQTFPIRWKPELHSDSEDFADASIMHPLKSWTHPIRQRRRAERQLYKYVVRSLHSNGTPR